MKRLLIIVAVVVCCAGTVLAQHSAGGSIGVFSDPFVSNCNIEDTGGWIHLYIYHMWTSGATAVQFKLKVPPEWTFMYDMWKYTTVGKSIDGVLIRYEACMIGPVYLGGIKFNGGNVGNCTYIEIVPVPGSPSGRIEALDCSEPPNKMYPTGGTGIVNPDERCNCDVPIQETSWGRIKSLYQ